MEEWWDTYCTGTCRCSLFYKDLSLIHVQVCNCLIEIHNSVFSTVVFLLLLTCRFFGTGQTRSAVLWPTVQTLHTNTSTSATTAHRETSPVFTSLFTQFRFKKLNLLSPASMKGSNNVNVCVCVFICL